MKLLKRILISMWILPLIMGILLLHGPKSISQFLRPIAPFFIVLLLLLMIGTPAYILIRLYKIGAKRNTGG